MSTILIGSYTSPFTRMLRLVMHERVPFEFQPLNYFEEAGDAYLKSINPINKIPLLIDNGQKIFDSRVIYNYISRKHGFAPLSVEDENHLSAIYGIMDTCANLFLLKKGGLDLAAHNWYVERQMERVPAMLDFISPWMQSLNPEKTADWSYPSMALYSVLYWGKFRGMIDYTNHPQCLRFLEAFKHKPGLKETDIPQ